MRLGIPSEGVYIWTPPTCSCRYAWKPREGLVLCDHEFQQLPDFFEPCVDHAGGGGDAPFRKAMQRALVRNMAACWVRDVHGDPAVDLDDFELEFLPDDRMVIRSYPDRFPVAARARLVSEVNTLAGPGAVRVK